MGVVTTKGNAPVRSRRYGLLVSVFLVSLLLLTVQTRGGGSGGASDVVAALMTPVQGLLVKIHRGAVGIWTTYTDWKGVRRENAALRAEAEGLRVQGLQRAETEQENLRLRVEQQGGGRVGTRGGRGGHACHRPGVPGVARR